MRRFGAFRSRVLLVGAALLILSSSAVAWALSARVEPVKQLTVHDANGRLLGRVIQVENGGAVVAIQVGETPVALTALKSVLTTTQNTVGTQVFFESDDCTGRPLLPEVPEEVALFPKVVLNNSRLYLVVGAEEIADVRSFMTFEGVCVQEEFSAQAWEGEFLVDLAQEFQPPFTMSVK